MYVWLLARYIQGCQADNATTMFVFPLSAVGNCFPTKVNIFNRFLIISSRILFTGDPKEMSWESKKRHYLSTFDERNQDDWMGPHQIPTWKQYAQKKDLPRPSSPPAGNTIDDKMNDVLADKVSVLSGDITKLKIDAIVNAANKYLKRGGGVDGAIHSAAGSDLQLECDTLNGCETGQAKITGGYQLPAKYVVHAVGPQGTNPQALGSCYSTSLELAMANDIRTIAFPCISTGIYGYPNEAAAQVATYTVRKFLERHPDKFDRIIFCVFLNVDKNLYEQILQTYFPVKLVD